MSIYKKAIKIWGFKAQLLLAIEEMSELTKELCKYVNRQDGNSDKICEEVADVEIMIEQLRECFDSQIINKFKKEKLERLKSRISKGIMAGE